MALVVRMESQCPVVVCARMAIQQVDLVNRGSPGRSSPSSGRRLRKIGNTLNNRFDMRLPLTTVQVKCLLYSTSPCPTAQAERAHWLKGIGSHCLSLMVYLYAKLALTERAKLLKQLLLAVRKLNLDDSKGPRYLGIFDLSESFSSRNRRPFAVSVDGELNETLTLPPNRGCVQIDRTLSDRCLRGAGHQRDRDPAVSPPAVPIWPVS